MLPVLIHIGPITIYSFGLLIILGIIAGTYQVWKYGRLSGISEERAIDMSILVILAGLIGARAMYVFSNWSYYQDDLWSIFRFWQGGLSFYGALLGGIVAIIILARRFHLSSGQLFDLATPAVAIGSFFGYLGALLNGTSFGSTTDWWWGIQAQGQPGHHHPSQAIEAVFQLTLFFLLLKIRRRVPYAGFLALSYLFVYSLGRFFLEFLRGDSTRLGPLSQSQWLAIFIALVSVGLIYLKLARLRGSWHISIREFRRLI